MSLECCERGIDLLCCEGERECVARPDPSIMQDDRVLQNLLVTEEKYTASPTYFKCVQTEIEPPMRKMVADWMLEICEAEQCQPDVFPLSVNILDRFLSTVRLKKSQLQLLGTVCLFLSSKLKESRSLSAERLVYYTANSITLEELRCWEVLVLARLKWDILAITPHDFLDHLLHRLHLETAMKRKVREHAQTFVTLCATHSKFIMYPPSMVAASCIGAAVHGLCTQTGVLNDVLYNLHKYTHIEMDCLKGCLEQIEEVMRRTMAELSSPSPSPSSTVVDVTSHHKLHATSSSSSSSETLSDTPTDVRDVHF